MLDSSIELKSPTFTQHTNCLTDYWLRILTFSEMKVFLALSRKIIGYHKTYDRVSLSQLMEMTGLTKKSILKGINGLIEKNLIKQEIEGIAGHKKTYYELTMDENTPGYKKQVNRDTKDTSPGILSIPLAGIPSIPTKESINKIKKEKEIYKEKILPIKKVKEQPIDEYRKLKERAPNVFVSDEDHDKLANIHGEPIILAAYVKTSEYKLGRVVQPKKEKYTDLYMVKNWHIKQAEMDVVRNQELKQREERLKRNEQFAVNGWQKAPSSLRFEGERKYSNSDAKRIPGLGR